MHRQHLLHLRDLDEAQVMDLIKTAISWKNGGTEVPLFFAQKFWVASFFVENSTRTKISFEIASRKLGCQYLDFPTDSSSLSKGESLLASFQCLQAMGVDLVVYRGPESVLTDLSQHLNMSLVSAGEGQQSHPSQALLDAMSFYCDFSILRGKKLLIAGDLKHSRVFASHRELAATLGIQLFYSGPPEFLPAPGYGQFVELEEAIGEMDMLMCLRVQRERHQSDLLQRSYLQDYGLTAARLQRLKPNARIYHPGPYNLGVEIDECVLSDPRCRIWSQVENSVYMRMAILAMLLKGR